MKLNIERFKLFLINTQSLFKDTVFFLILKHSKKSKQANEMTVLKIVKIVLNNCFVQV